MTIATWIAFLAYAAAAVALARRGRRRREVGAEFWTAGRSLGAPAVGMSLSAGFLSISWSCVYAVQLYYWYGLGAFWLMTLPWLLALGGIHLLARRYHGLTAFSQPEMVGQRFGRAPRRLIALAVAFVFLVWGGAEIYVAARLLGPALALPLWAAVAAIALVVGVYSSLGGFRAVVDTDRMQYAIVALYILAMAALAVRGLMAAAPEESGVLGWLLESPPHAAMTDRPWTAALAPGLTLIALTLVAYLPGWLFETDLWLRVQAARDLPAARGGVAFAMVNAALFVGVVPGFIGIAALALFPPLDGSIPPGLGNEGDAIFAALVNSYAPPALAVLVAVGLVAAAMSTIDTCTNVMALSLAYDLLELRDRGNVARGATILAVTAAAIFALFTESLWDIFYLSSGVLTTTVAFPMAAVFLPRVRARAVTWSAAAGLVTTVAAYFLDAGGRLVAYQPAALTESGIAFILWGALAAAAGALIGQLASEDPGVDGAPGAR